MNLSHFYCVVFPNLLSSSCITMMKLFPLVVSVLIALLTCTLVLSEECTSDELANIGSIYSSAMTDACPDMNSAAGDMSASYCTPDCIAFITDALDKLPDCSTSGVNIKAAVQATIDYCEAGKADTSNVLTGSLSTSSNANASNSNEVKADPSPSTTEKSMASTTKHSISSVIVKIAVLIVAAAL
ncbi:putative elicitin [Plasmopara halstedii]